MGATKAKKSFSPIDYETKRMTMDFSCTYCRILVCSSFFLLETLGGQLLNIALLFPVKINYRENLLVSTVNLKNKMPLFPHTFMIIPYGIMRSILVNVAHRAMRTVSSGRGNAKLNDELYFHMAVMSTHRLHTH